jgi:hypothetical protein
LKYYFNNISILVISQFTAWSLGKKEHATYSYFSSVLIWDNNFRILTSGRQGTYHGEKAGL